MRADAWKSIRGTAWPDMAVQGHAGPASFSRRPDVDRPARELILVRPDRRSIHWLRVDLDGEDEVIGTRDGRELLRRPLPPDTLEFATNHGIHPGAGFALADDYFPLPDGWQQDQASALAERQRRVDAALAPAAVQPSDLPADLVPHVAWVLCEYLCDRGRLARSGRLVPGAHVFFFRTGLMQWQHQETVESGFGDVVGTLRKRFRTFALSPHARNAEGTVVAGLLVRVSDTGRITARKLIWLGPGDEMRETGNLRRAGDTLPEGDFRQAMDDLRRELPGLRDDFLVSTQQQLRGLFTA